MTQFKPKPQNYLLPKLQSRQKK